MLMLSKPLFNPIKKGFCFTVLARFDNFLKVVKSVLYYRATPRTIVFVAKKIKKAAL
jgi:hypothetical protein